ncbi:FixH family protein [Mucilaginibacter rigui]|uniref:FixH family protein n=1 Tax=Mucilaginibacter rigui TaxID=534635 RepID=A0ABR7X185_9SPHI|nr:FixH family protein [Mucilaginibacter rigui]MBD1384366.1 FixH family protein [Mucilaginibacter rigui]
MNWGKGIILGMCLFMAFIVGMVVFMFRQPDDYDKRYYEKGLAFDADYKKEKQVIIDNAKPAIGLTKTQLQVKFATPVNGTINFVRPSDGKLDKKIELPGTAAVNIPLSGLLAGQWQLVIEWTANGHAYLYKQEVLLP